MARPRTGKWNWDPPKEEAATLIAAAELTNKKIAEKVGVSEVTLYEWIGAPVFAARIEEQRARIREEITQRGIAVVENRVARKNDDWQRLKQIRTAREEYWSKRPEHPGIETGLIVHDQKSIGSGVDAEIIDVYRLDTALLNSMTALEDSVAIELGQRVQKQEIEVRDGAIADELEAKLRALAKRHSDKAAAPTELPEAAGDAGA